MKYVFTLFAAGLLLWCTACSHTIDMSALGLGNDGSQNAVPYLQEALKQASRYSNPVIRFPKGRYDFTPDIQGISEQLYSPNIIRNIDNLTIDGGGSSFIFHGRTECFNVADCSDFTICNFSIDWDRPMVTQAEFVMVSDEAVRIRIDKQQYPYHIENGVVWYDGEGWSSNICWLNQVFDKESRDIIPTTHDNATGKFWARPATEVEEGVIEFAGPFDWERRPEVGNIITMYAYIYPSDALHFERCRNVTTRDIVLHHGGSMAVFARTVDGLHIDNFDVSENLEKDRYFANMADGFHIKGCKGKVLVENCDFNGGGDDFFNVHNMYLSVKEVLSDTLLLMRSYKGFDHAEGDSVWFVGRESGQRSEPNRIKSIKYLSGDPWPGADYEIVFDHPVPAGLTPGDVMENMTWCPEVEVRYNRVFKRHRATGVRCTTPRKAVVHHNWFNTAGHAILIEGDAVWWLESGGNNDLVIRDNVFDNCMTSGSTTGGRWEWGEAVIDITPSFKAASPDTPGGYHKNVVIKDNEFRMFDYPILRARSVENLQFIGNKVVLSDKYQPYTVLKYNFLFEGCRKVKISGNDFPEGMLGHNVATYMMRDEDLEIAPDQKLSVDKDAGKVVEQFEW